MKRIFFVEDDLSLINGLSFAIRKQGYELTIARTIAEAEKLWANGNYDLAVLDVTLPDGSGFDLCQKIRASSKVPIMFLTAVINKSYPSAVVHCFLSHSKNASREISSRSHLSFSALARSLQS